MPNIVYYLKLSKCFLKNIQCQVLKCATVIIIIICEYAINLYHNYNYNHYYYYEY